MPQYLQLGAEIQSGARSIVAVHTFDRLPPFLETKTDFVLKPAGSEDCTRVHEFCYRAPGIVERRAAVAQSIPSEGLGGITWAAGTFGHGSSFPWFNYITVKTLRSLGVRVKLLWHPANQIDYRIPFPRVLRDSDLDNTIAIANVRWTPPAKVMDTCSRNAAVFMGYFQAEATRIHPSLANWMNFHFDAMLATSTETRKALLVSGVKVPVHVFGHGIDPEQFPFIDRPLKRATYTFFHFADVQPRKGTDVLIKAFRALKHKHARLYIKAQWKNPEYAGYLKLCEGDSRITWDTTTYPPERLADLMSQMDAGVFPSRGEGFGIPKLECEATGMTCIATRFGGYLDHSPEDATLLLSVKEYIPAQVDFGKQAEPDLDHLVELMSWCIDHPIEARERGRKASKYVHASWKWTDKIGELLEVLKGYGLRSS